MPQEEAIDIMDGKILVVDDEKEIADLIEVYLLNDGYTVYKFYNGSDALKCINETELDLAILDIMLPDIDGFHICQKIREKYFYPVIMLTAKVEDNDKIMGLAIGADDYITKPFRPRELVARINTALRKKGHSPSAFEICGLDVDLASGIVKKYGREIFLSALEYRLLLVFINNPHNIITRDCLLDELWDAAGEFVNNNTLTVYIKRLREKIEDDPASPKIILTVRGTGYRLGGNYVS